jgi:hypothetical protein
VSVAYEAMVKQKEEENKALSKWGNAESEFKSLVESMQHFNTEHLVLITGKLPLDI